MTSLYFPTEDNDDDDLKGISHLCNTVTCLMFHPEIKVNN